MYAVLTFTQTESSSTIARPVENGRTSVGEMRAPSWGVGIDLRMAPKPFLIKEVIQPQVPLRLPCYDFTPVTNHSYLGRLRSPP